MSKRLLTSANVRERLGVSGMTIWRYLQDEELCFPRPAVIRRRRYWDADEIESFVTRQRANDNVPATRKTA